MKNFFGHCASYHQLCSDYSNNAKKFIKDEDYKRTYKDNYFEVAELFVFSRQDNNIGIKLIYILSTENKYLKLKTPLNRDLGNNILNVEHMKFTLMQLKTILSVVKSL